MHKKSLLTCCFIFVIVGLSFSQSSFSEDRLNAVIKPEMTKFLLEHGKIKRVLYAEKDMSVALAPDTEISRSVVNGWTKGTPVFMVETLYLYKKNSSKQKNIDKILHSVSKLEGIEYYSTSRKKMRTLYKQSYAVEIANDKDVDSIQKIEDPLNATEMLVLQEDLTFGEYLYKYTYHSSKDGHGFNCENTQTLKYSIFKIADPYEMNVSLSVTDIGDYLLVYVNTRANIAKLRSLRKKLENSFSTRADAVYNWFITEYEK